jgi:hypothetical protein
MVRIFDITFRNPGKPGPSMDRTSPTIKRIASGSVRSFGGKIPETAIHRGACSIDQTTHKMEATKSRGNFERVGHADARNIVREIRTKNIARSHDLRHACLSRRSPDNPANRNSPAIMQIKRVTIFFISSVR